MRLLLVEDDQGIIDFLTKGLREAAYAVDVVVDPGPETFCVSGQYFI